MESRVTTKATIWVGKGIRREGVLKKFAPYIFSGRRGRFPHFTSAPEVGYLQIRYDFPTVEPIDFCRKWVRKKRPGQRGYVKACVEELAEITELAKTTIAQWGPGFSKRPRTVLPLLRREDKLREIEKKLRKIHRVLDRPDK